MANMTALLVIVIIILIIVIAWMSFKSKIKKLLGLERYRTNDDGRRMDSAYITNIDAFQPKIETQDGVSTIDNKDYDAMSQESLSQNIISNKITESMNEAQEMLINNAEVNENTNQTQIQNNIIADVKNAAIFDQGLSKRGGLSEFESKQLNAAQNYNFEKGEVPTEYQKILSTANNTIASFTTGTYMLNIDQKGASYVPQ